MLQNCKKKTDLIINCDNVCRGEMVGKWWVNGGVMCANDFVVDSVVVQRGLEMEDSYKKREA